MWGTSGFCTWPYLIYNVHDPSGKYHSQNTARASIFTSMILIVHSIPTGCISFKRSATTGGMYQGYKQMWMTNNLLKLNEDKPELIVITTHDNPNQNRHIAINIEDSLITPGGEPPRNLGVLFDSTGSFNDHVSKICKGINYNLYFIDRIRKNFDTPTAEKNDQVFYNTTPGFLQQCPLWCKWLFNISATALSEQYRLGVVPVPQIRPHYTSLKGPTLASCWPKNLI